MFTRAARLAWPQIHRWKSSVSKHWLGCASSVLNCIYFVCCGFCLCGIVTRENRAWLGRPTKEIEHGFVRQQEQNGTGLRAGWSRKVLIFTSSNLKTFSMAEVTIIPVSFLQPTIIQPAGSAHTAPYMFGVPGLCRAVLRVSLFACHLACASSLCSHSFHTSSNRLNVPTCPGGLRRYSAVLDLERSGGCRLDFSSSQAQRSDVPCTSFLRSGCCGTLVYHCPRSPLIPGRQLTNYVGFPQP